jgi:hypothetical protein
MTPELFRMSALQKALHLEMQGLKSRGRSAYAIIKEEYGLRGNRSKVLEQYTRILENEQRRAANPIEQYADYLERVTSSQAGETYYYD